KGVAAEDTEVEQQQAGGRDREDEADLDDILARQHRRRGVIHREQHEHEAREDAGDEAERGADGERLEQPCEGRRQLGDRFHGRPQLLMRKSLVAPPTSSPVPARPTTVTARSMMFDADPTRNPGTSTCRVAMICSCGANTWLAGVTVAITSVGI